MKRPAALLLLALVLTAASVHAAPPETDARTAKRQLIDEVLKAMDVQGLADGTFNVLFAELIAREHTDSEANESTEMRALRDRVYASVGYAQRVEDVYVPLLDKQFTADELTALLAFVKTRPGQKLVRILPDLGVAGIVRTSGTLNAAARATEEEMKKEDARKHPWKETMADLRTVATAVEARATDENEYPGGDYEGLAAILTPTYILTMPRADAWGTPYVYVGGREHYRLVSAGADKHFDWASTQPGAFGTILPHARENPADDIVFEDGQFVQYPKESVEGK
jgi:hypothetical protein